MPSAGRPLRLYLDAGVAIDGFFNRWGFCKGVLILTVLRHRFRAVVSEPVYAEARRNIERKKARLSAEERNVVLDGVEGWFKLARPDRLPWPTDDDMLAYAGLLSAVRHRNDLPAVVAAYLAHPDWVLSTNTEHWNPALAARTGLRIATPAEFLATLQPD
jgi:hypothetical protein